MAIRLKVLTGCPVKLNVAEGYPIYPEPYTGEYEITPTEEEIGLQTKDLMMVDDVTIHGIPSDYVGSAVDRRDSSSITVSGPDVTVPFGFYEEDASVSIASGSAAVPNVNIEKNPTISVSSGGLITATVSTSETVSPVITAGYVDSGSSGTISFSGTATQQLTVKSSSDLSMNGPTVTAPAGFYADNASATVSSGNIGVPYIVKDAVTNHSVKLTPYYTKTEGWVYGSGSFSGVQTTVTAADLVSGTLSITANTTYDVTNYAEVDVAVPIPELQTINTSYTASTVQQTDTIVPTGAYQGIEEVNLTIEPYTLENVSHTFTPTTTAQTQSFTASTADALGQVDITVSAVTSGSIGNPNVVVSKDASYLYETITYPNFHEGYITNAPALQTHFNLENKNVSPSLTAQTVTPTGDSYYLNSVTVTAVTAGSAGTPTATKGTVTNHSVTVTPSVTNITGYINGGTVNGTAVTVTASELVSGSQTLTANNTYDVTNLAEVVVLVDDSPELQIKTNIDPTLSSQTIYADGGYDGLYSVQINAMPSGTAGTPSATKGAVNNHSITVTPSVTNSTGYITGGTINGTAVTVSASELVSGTYSVTSAGTADVTNYATVSVPSGTAGTPSASKGAVTNHAITVTPSVTNSAGFISGGSINGTAVTVSASELVSGTLSITTNTTYDVTNYQYANVNVAGIDISDTTLTADKALAGYYFYTAQGVKTEGTITDGNNIGYGITDGTIPRVGIAKVGYAEIGA
jgi:hypothetical protein